MVGLGTRSLDEGSLGSKRGVRNVQDNRRDDLLPEELAAGIVVGSLAFRT